MDEVNGPQYVFPRREEIDLVLDAVRRIYDEYGLVTIMDVRELIGLPTSAYTDSRWGWDDAGLIQVKQTREGWVLTFPPMKEVNPSVEQRVRTYMRPKNQASSDMLSDEHIRLECLKAAVRMNPEMSVFNETIIERAKFFENYVRGN